MLELAAFFIAEFVLSVIDWWAVEIKREDVERLAKPLVMMALIVTVLVADINPTLEAAKWWFVVALCFSLLGDVALLRYFGQFKVGLVAFLLGHIAYIGGFLSVDTSGSWLGFVATAIAVVAVNAVGSPIAKEAESLAFAVWLYIIVISALVIVAGATGSWIAFLGALLFYASDGLLGWDKFIGPAPGGRTLVHMTYHLGQGGLVAWLVFS